MKKRGIITRSICQAEGCLAKPTAVAMLAFAILPILAAQALGQDIYVSPASAPLKLKVDLSKLPKVPVSHGTIPRGVIPGTVGPPRPPSAPDPVWQRRARESGEGRLTVTPSQFTTPNPSFAGMGGGGFPPDTNGAPGKDHYIQTINVSFQIWDKQGNSLAGPTGIQSLWNAAGAPATNQCRSEFFASDPYVQYDQLADRWVMSFGAGATIPFGGLSDFHIMCFAVSQGPNPVTSGWFLYHFDVVHAADYPKFGVWPDAYYMITQEGYNGGNLDATMFDRGNMLNGNPATFQQKSFFAFTGFGGETVIALPSELTGPPPPVGSPNFYVRPVDGTLFGDGADRIEIWEAHVDWGVPANTSITATQTLSPAGFDSSCDAGGDNSLNQDCINQPGTANLLDGQTTWPRSPLEYYNFGDHETITLSHGVNVTGATPGLVGMRWYEIRRTPPGSGSWVLYQQGTFEPTDLPNSNTTTVHRWNGSLAIDSAGNMALGYNVSNPGTDPTVPAVSPGIRYVGRLATDALGEMTTPEVTLATGTSVITGGDRWGDYSTIRLDPVDGCTFWYTAEFLNGGQASQIGAFRFPTCNPADLSVTKTGPATATAGTQISYTITVTNNGPANATNVTVTDTLPAGVTFQSSSAVCNSGDVLTGCDLGSLANGASNTFTIQVLVPANFLSLISASTSNITNSVSVTSDQLDPDTSNNTATATTNIVQSADVQITKICKPDSPAPAGSSGFCTLTVSNNGPSDAQNVVVTDTLTDANPFAVTSITGAVCTPSSSGFVTSFSTSCSLGTLAAGGSTSIVVNVTANVGGNINDLATVSSSTPDPNTSNNQATGTVTFFSSADLSIAKGSAPNPVVAGTNLTYTINVGNAGPSPATNVVVKDTLPGQVSVVSATPSQGSCTGGIPGNPAQPMTCTLGTVANSGSATITVVVTVASNTPTGTILVNNATVTSDVSDPNNANNSATAYTNVSTSADLAIVKTSDKSVYKPTSIITYTITVTNNGPSDSLAVVVTDTLPALKQAIYKSDTGGCVKNATPPTILTCSLGTVPAGTSKSFNIYELVKGHQGLVSNTATVASTAPTPTPDPNLANNTSTRTVTIGP